ncbi:MAG: hypothetical protein Q8Q39_01555, partial [bacterium]|nr:hypothetical protein [bacterium]
MADQKPIEKSYQAGGSGDEGTATFTIRTMKKDIERLRSGLPLHETAVAAPVSAHTDAARKLAGDIAAHSPTERPPMEVATPLPTPERRAQTMEQAPVFRPSGTSRPQSYSVPVTPLGAPGGTTSLGASNARPIETTAKQARPATPQEPRGGTIEIESAAEGTGTGVAFFARLFPTRKRLIITAILTLILLIAGAYVLFAKFGRPLPGTLYVMNLIPGQTKPPDTGTSPTPTAAPSPQATQSTSPTPAPTIEVTPTPLAQPKSLPFSRIARITLPANATAVTLLERLTNFSHVSLEEGDFANMMVVRDGNGGVPIGGKEFFSLIGSKTPEGLFDQLSEEITLYVYAPRDAKDPGAAQQETHFAVLIPVTGSLEALRDALRTWEATMGGDLAPFALDR